MHAFRHMQGKGHRKLPGYAMGRDSQTIFFYGKVNDTIIKLQVGIENRVALSGGSYTFPDRIEYCVMRRLV